jgi:tetratricopeptide (TPR) repeat protein
MIPAQMNERAPRDAGPVPLSSRAELMARAAETERHGRWPEAVDEYSGVFLAAVREGALPQAVDALRGTARALQRLEEYESAAEAADLSFHIAELNGLAQAAARAVNVLAVTCYLQRDWSTAQSLYEDALERALDVGDDELIGYTCQNLGVVANILGHLREARVRYLESIGSAVRSGRKANEAAAYNNLGLVCADLGDWMESMLYFDRGLEIAERIGDLAQSARLRANRAEPLLAVGDFAEARRTLDRAEEIAIQINARPSLADVARYRGRLLRLEGDPEGAERELRRALQITREANLSLSRAETLEEIGRLRREQGLRSEARAALHEAHSLFATLDAVRDMARTAALLAEEDPPAA